MQNDQAVKRQIGPIDLASQCEVQDRLRQKSVLLICVKDDRVPLSNELLIRQHPTVKDTNGVHAA